MELADFLMSPGRALILRSLAAKCKSDGRLLLLVPFYFHILLSRSLSKTGIECERTRRNRDIQRLRAPFGSSAYLSFRGSCFVASHSIIPSSQQQHLTELSTPICFLLPGAFSRLCSVCSPRKHTRTYVHRGPARNFTRPRGVSSLYSSSPPRASLFASPFREEME